MRWQPQTTSLNTAPLITANKSGHTVNFLTCILELFGSAMGTSLLHRGGILPNTHLFTPQSQVQNVWSMPKLIKANIPCGILKFAFNYESSEGLKLICRRFIRPCNAHLLSKYFNNHYLLGKKTVILGLFIKECNQKYTPHRAFDVYIN